MSDLSLVYFSMAAIGGSGSGAGGTGRAGLSEEEICRIIATTVAEPIRELSGSGKTVLIKEFDWRYAAVA